MATQLYTWTGKIKWAQNLFAPNQWGAYTINLYPDEASRKEIRSLKLRNIIKEDDDGFFFTFKRSASKRDRKGELLGPPEVSGIDEGQLIGNGSTADVTVSVYDYRAGVGSEGPYPAGKASQLEYVEILDLVEYEKPNEEEVVVEEVTKPKKKGMPF